MRNPETKQVHLHHHFCVVEKLKEVVFKLHLDEILLNTIWITALQTSTSKLMMGYGAL